MSNDVISVEHLTKQYDLGVIGTGTLSRDLNRWWARVRKQPDPYTRIGQKDAFARIGESILALDDVSFTVQQGEALGIIGRNGAGKSTLLKILSRVTAPTDGVVKVKGRIGSLLEVGTGFHPELTGRENVYLNGAILGMKKAEVTKKFEEIVDFAGVEKFIDTPVKRYSSGMYVRLAFAVAAHLDPEILIVDEVLAVGDAEFQKKCLGKMGDVTGEGRTVLFVSHNMSAIKTLCNSCMLMTGGKLGNFGETDVIVGQYIASSIEQKTVTLSNRIDRTGTGIVRFTACEIYKDLNRKMTTNSCTGDHLFISLSLKAEEKTEVFIGLQLVDMMGKTITSFNSREGGVTFILNPGSNDILLEIPFLSILEGDYLINGSIVRKTTFESYDRIEGIARLSVSPKDLFDAGVAFRAYHGVAIIPHIWSDLNQKKQILHQDSNIQKFT